MSTLLRELSDDEDESVTAQASQGSSDGSLSSSEPHQGEFRRYLVTVEAIPPGMSTVTWWGVRHNLLYHWNDS